MAESFEQAIALTRTEDGAHRLEVRDGWQQGRGAFGGLVLGALAQAMIEHEADGARRLRAITGSICGPVLVGEARIASRVLRRGNNQTDLSATLEQSGATLAHASVVLAAERKVGPLALSTMQAPTPPPWRDVREIQLAPFGPAFAQHYEYRLTGPLPFSGASEPVVELYVRERVPPLRMSAAALIARVDAPWPAYFSVEKAPRPGATVSFMAELLVEPTTLDPAEPLFYRARAIAQQGGYVVELRELWSGGTLVALNQQLFAVLG